MFKDLAIKILHFNILLYINKQKLRIINYFYLVKKIITIKRKKRYSLNLHLMIVFLSFLIFFFCTLTYLRVCDVVTINYFVVHCTMVLVPRNLSDHRHPRYSNSALYIYIHCELYSVQYKQ